MSTDTKHFKTLQFLWSTKKAWFYLAHAKSEARFARTKLGSIWLGLVQVITLIILTFTYSRVLGVSNIKEYFLYLAAGLMIWNTVSTPLNSGCTIFDSHKGTILSYNINPAFYIAEDWGFNALTMLYSSLPVLLLMVAVEPKIMLNLPLFMLTTINILTIMAWPSIILATASLRYKDLGQLIPIFMTIMFLTSPILYKATRLGSMRIFVSLNPLYQVLDQSRNALIIGEFHFVEFIVLTTVNISMLLLSLKILEKRAKLISLYV